MALSAGREKNELKENTYNIEGSPSRATFFRVNSCEIMFKYSMAQIMATEKYWNNNKRKVHMQSQKE